MTHWATDEVPEPDPGTEPAPPPPVLRAERLGLRGGRGWVFRDLSLIIPPHAVGAVCGPAGSGRTMALLALSGRAVAMEGALTVAGASTLPAIRARTSVARIGGAIAPEPDLRIRDHVREREVFGATGDLGRSAAALGVALHADTVFGDLGALDAFLCAVALAAMDEPALVVVDDVGLGLDDRERALAWQGLARLAAQGPAVLAAAVEPHASHADVTHLLEAAPCAS